MAPPVPARPSPARRSEAGARTPCGAVPRHGGMAALALLGLLGLAGCAAPPPGEEGAASGRGAPRSPAALAALLPDSVAGFRRGATVPASAGEGLGIAYATVGRRTAAALVDLDPPPAALAAGEGPDAPAAEAALARMLAESERPGSARVLREEGRFLLPATGGAPALRCVETVGRYGRERVQGLLCAGILRGTLLRLRVTMPRQDPPPADPRAFASGIVAALRRGG